MKLLGHLFVGGRLPVAIVGVAALGYPLAVLATGAPPFPSAQECIVPATGDGNIQLVLGRFQSVLPANSLLRHAKKLGFVTAEVQTNSCGDVNVIVPGYTNLAGAQDAVAEARRVGLSASLQLAP